MPTTYRTDVILAPASAAGPEEVGRINRALVAAGLGPAVQAATAAAQGLAVLPVVGADPVEVRDALRRARRRGEDLPELTPDFQYNAGTVADGSHHEQVYHPSSKRIGHGSFAWLPAPRHVLGDGEGWEPAESSPVVALLDTGVEEHDWLPKPDADSPFCVDATEAFGWSPPVPVPADEKSRDGRMRFGPYFGHGTFLAGIIRMEAPTAQVLSMRTMGHDGRASIANVAHALGWVADRGDRGEPVDVVLMAFGCVTDPDDDLSVHEPVRAALRRLDDLSVPVVISAGNDGVEHPAYPAAFAADPELSHVASVGARTSPTTRAPYSNHGPWVRRWRDGTNVASLMPLTTSDTGGDGYAWWSGTSFAAARHAAEVVNRSERAAADRRAGASA